jgi:signal transduction histidine kinase
VNVLRSVDATIELLRHRLGGIEIEKAIQPGIRVTGFADQIDQIVLHLLTNAVEAIGSRGGRIRIAMETRGQEVVLTVADDGRGMTDEVRARIFDPFFTTKDVGQGAGLGLTVVHGIVQRHGGRIDVDSAPGRGAVVRVVLPVFAGFVAAAQPAARP